MIPTVIFPAVTLLALAAAQPPQGGGFAQCCHNLGHPGNTTMVVGDCGTGSTRSYQVDLSDCLINTGGTPNWESM
jgi:hypothetical protein